MMKELLKTHYHFSNYQIAQLEFFFKTLFSELSKILFIGFLFRNELDIYAITMLTLCLLRTSTGGLHCKTYWGCLFASTTYIVLALKVLPLIMLPTALKALLALLCAPINYFVGPVTSDVHMPLTEKVIKKSRIKAACFIILFALLIYAFPENKYMIPVFWITITHTFQLVLAKIRKIRKGGRKNEAETD